MNTSHRASTAVLIVLLGLTSPAAQRTDSGRGATIDRALMHQGAGIARTDAGLVAAWNELAYDIAFAEDQFRTFKGHRSFAMMHLAMHDALNSIVPVYQRYAYDGRRLAAHPVAAAAQAAYEVLAAQYPDQQAALATALGGWIGGVPDAPLKTRGIELGKAAAAAILARRQGDGWDSPGDYEFRSEPGQYQTTPPWNGFVLQPGFRFARPFALEYPGQLRPAPPPLLETQAYARAFHEVKAYGAVDSRRRSEDQTAYALWWMEFSEGSVNRLARALVIDRGTHLWMAARLFAHLNMSLFDGYVAIWDAKYEYNHWRPHTAIRAADADHNGQTTPDPGWEPLRPTPPFPEYASAHAAGCAATMEVLERSFGRHVTFTMTTTTAPPEMPTRRFDSFRDAARECADSRVRLGWHFRYATDAGLALGRQVARHSIRHHLQAEPITSHSCRSQPVARGAWLPEILLAAPPGR